MLTIIKQWFSNLWYTKIKPYSDSKKPKADSVKDIDKQLRDLGISPLRRSRMIKNLKKKRANIKKLVESGIRINTR